jgi:hypothetical protein
MAFAAGRSFVILQSMAQNNPEAKKLLDDLNNISQEDFEKRFGELLNTPMKIDDGEPIKFDETKEEAIDGIKPIDEETSFGQPNIKTNETKSAIDGIKGMDYEPTKYVYKNVLPYRDKILELQNKFEDMMLEDGFSTFDMEDDFEEIYDNDEVYEMYDGIINNDVSEVKSSIDKFVEKYQDTAGDGDSQGRRNVFLEEYFKPAYKPPKVVPPQEFEQLSKGKTVLFRGVGTQSTVKNTLFGDKAWYMYGGAKGDGIYMSSLQNVAADYSLGQNTIMEFIVPDDLKTVNEKVLQRVGRRFSERINEKIRSLAMGKIDEETAKELESLENLDNVMRNCGYTALAIIMGFDAVDVPFVGSLSEDEIKSQRKTQGVKYGKNFKLYKNYVFLNLDKLIAKDITKGEK